MSWSRRAVDGLRAPSTAFSSVQKGQCSSRRRPTRTPTPIRGTRRHAHTRTQESAQTHRHHRSPRRARTARLTYLPGPRTRTSPLHQCLHPTQHFPAEVRLHRARGSGKVAFSEDEASPTGAPPDRSRLRFRPKGPQLETEKDALVWHEDNCCFAWRKHHRTLRSNAPQANAPRGRGARAAPMAA